MHTCHSPISRLTSDPQPLGSCDGKAGYPCNRVAVARNFLAACGQCRTPHSQGWWNPISANNSNPSNPTSTPTLEPLPLLKPEPKP